MRNLQEDIHNIVHRVDTHWDALKDSHLLMTGCTGFFGKWLIESFLNANRTRDLNARLWLVSRSPERFLATAKHLINHPDLIWIRGDIRDFDIPSQRFSHVIHGAMDIARPSDSPAEILSVGRLGTVHLLDLCRKCEVKNLLFLSSGAAYGKQPPDIEYLREDHIMPNTSRENLSPYALSKQLSEEILLKEDSRSDMKVTIARCFAFAGPMMNLNSPFALTDFIRRLLNKQDIEIKGNAQTVRSYMYASDLAVWLWAILFRGAHREAYNVGSDDAISILDLAARLKEISGTNVTIRTDLAGIAFTEPDRYLPSIEKAVTCLNLNREVDTQTTLSKTFEYFRAQSSTPY